MRSIPDTTKEMFSLTLSSDWSELWCKTDETWHNYKTKFRYRTDMRLSSLCRDRFNQIKPLSQSRVIWNLNFKSHTWTHFCFKVQTRSAKAEPNESFLRVHEHRFSGAVSSLPYISQYWKMSSRLVFLEGCCAVWREIKWCLTSSSFYYFFRNSNGRATA